MTSSPHGLYIQGYTRATMADTKGCEPARGSQSQKVRPSSDWSLQLDSMKPELLVIADQHAAVNTFPGLVLGDGLALSQPSAAGKPLSLPPGEYGRKTET